MMALPVPNLDDRRFQDLVDDAKRLVQRRCPEWTDHNVSDPGVTLIETFAFMTDQLLYRLNRVPDRLYIKFLEMIGVRLLPPTPARTLLTFWLTAPQTLHMTIPISTTSMTMRTETDEPIIFTTVEDLVIVPCALQNLATEQAGNQFKEDRTDVLNLEPFPAFSEVPQADDAMYLVLTEPVPSCVVRLYFRCRIDGVGVAPDDPPMVWEAWNGNGWDACEVEKDDTGGLNRDGEIFLHIPKSHQAGILDLDPTAVGDELRGGLVRARAVQAEEGQPGYSSSPMIHGLSAATIGATVEAINAEIVQNEALGQSEGVPGQRFKVTKFPVLAGATPAILDVSTDDDGWEEWTEVSDFAVSRPDDKHFVLDASMGEVLFGPAVRLVDGGFRQYGAFPPKGAWVRMTRYSVGGGRAGNVAKGAIRGLRSPIPFIATVSNRVAAQGGVDAETIDGAKDRGPIQLRTRSRAVTAEDFEQITKEAAPEVARVRAVAAGDGPEAGCVKVLIVPAAPMVDGQIRFEDLVPSPDTMEKIKDRLDETRLIGTRILIEPPLYRGVTVVCRIVAKARSSAVRIRAEALEALDAYFSPLSGGPDGDGWPWGRPVQAGEVFAVLQGIKGVGIVQDVRVFGANPLTGERGEPSQRLELEPNSLVFSYEHQIRVEDEMA
jgi:predicted phage baseplate assembly protein